MSWAGQIVEVVIPIWGEPGEDGLPVLIGAEPGYHLNTNRATRDACLAADPAFAAFIVEPETPRCIWAGDPADTVCLRFDDEAQARASAIGAWWVDEGDLT